MTTEEYDQLLAEIADTRIEVRLSMDRLNRATWYLEALLNRLDREERRIAGEALASTHSAGRKLVVGE